MSIQSLSGAAVRKADESARTIRTFVEAEGRGLAECATAIAGRLREGAGIFTMGNGGSACDAQHLAVEFTHPILEKRRAFRAQALCTDTTLLTAVGNDEDFSLVYAAQLRLSARRGDIVFASSTSGSSASINRGLKVAEEMGLFRVGLSGKDGGRMVDSCDHCFTVPSYSIHRIQECHVVLLHLLWDLVHVALGEEDVL